MAPFSEAVDVKIKRTLEDGTRVYSAVLDPKWTVASVSHGGYLLAVILEAVIQAQAKTNQPDPIHLTSHFYLPTRPADVEVHIKMQRAGRRFSNITADLMQDGNLNLTTHIIIGTLASPFVVSSDKSTPTIIPPHPYAARIPLRTHSAIAKLSRIPPKLTFREYIKSAFDTTVTERRDDRAGRGDGEGGFDFGAWYELLGEKPGERVGLPAIAFLADMCLNTPNALPHEDRPGESWFPTLTLSLEFKVSLSSLPPGSIAPHTFAVFSTGRFIHAGRHEVQSEVWTAPSTLKAADQIPHGDEKWRDRMVCVAIASQMALTLPLEVNKRKGGATDAKL